MEALLTGTFHPTKEMISVKVLRRLPYKELHQYLQESPKLLVTLRGEPRSVLVDYEAYQELIAYVQELEQQLEEAELVKQFGERLRRAGERQRYVAEDEFIRRLDDLDQ